MLLTGARWLGLALILLGGLLLVRSGVLSGRERAGHAPSGSSTPWRVTALVLLLAGAGTSALCGERRTKL